jgi:hypothetical protein
MIPDLAMEVAELAVSVGMLPAFDRRGIARRGACRLKPLA